MMYTHEPMIASRAIPLLMSLAALLMSLADPSGATASGEATTRPTSQPTSTRPADQDEAAKAARLAEAVDTIAHADNPYVAMKAYAQGSAVDRSHTPLHEAHLKRMLKFGLVHPAAIAAKVLHAYDNDNALAQAMLGYHVARNARKEEYADALVLTARALKQMPDNDGVLANFGNLLAWRRVDGAKAELPGDVRRELDELATAVAEKTAFKNAYERAHKQFSERAKLRDAQQSKIEAIEAKIQPRIAEIHTIDKTMRELTRAMKALEEDVNQTQHAINVLQYKLDHPDQRSDHETYHFLITRKAQFEQQLTLQQGRLDRAKRDHRDQRIKGIEIVGEINKLKAAKRIEEQQLARFLRKHQPTLFWDPPAIDGEITPETTLASFRRPPNTEPADNEDSTPTALPAEADKMLQLAENYFRAGLADKARALCKDVRDRWPGTEAASRADTLLAKIDAQN